MDLGERFNAGLAEHKAGRLDAAAAIYREVLAITPHYSAAQNLGAILTGQFRFHEAAEAFEQALALRPAAPASLAGLGGARMRTHEPQAAEAALRKALAAAPDDHLARYRLGWTLLMQAKYAEGWPYWESREPRLAQRLDHLNFPEWKGEDLTGRSIMVWGEQGLGDEIQVARFLADLRARGAARITIGCLAPNIRLMRSLDVDQVLCRQDAQDVGTHDFWVMAWSLPGRLGVTPGRLSGDPYLAAPPKRGDTIGVAWKGNPRNSNDAHRSIADDRLLARIPGAVELVPGGDMVESADAVAAHRLIITVDTAWAHLAGAMGWPCWVLLSHAGVDWRWFPEGATSPWYRSVRLFWQNTPGDWDGVLDEVAAALAGA